MTTRGFVSICVKLIAVYYLVQTIASLAGAGFYQVFFWSSDMGRLYRIMAVAIPAFITLVLVLLIRESDIFADRLIQEDSPLAIPQVSLGDLQSVAFSCIGLSFIISALGELVPIIGYHFLISQYKYSQIFWGNLDGVYSNMAGILLRLGCGVFLFLYPRGLITVWRWLQEHRGLKDA
jgi:hypothetical protein